MTSQGKTTLLNSGRPYGATVVSVIGTLLTQWRIRQRARRDLSRLDDHMLRDIGLDRATANREAARKFWQD